MRYVPAAVLVLLAVIAIELGLAVMRIPTPPAYAQTQQVPPGRVNAPNLQDVHEVLRDQLTQLKSELSQVKSELAALKKGLEAVSERATSIDSRTAVSDRRLRSVCVWVAGHTQQAPGVANICYATN